MSTIPETVSSHSFRSVRRGDLPQITALAKQAQWPEWIQQDLPRILKARHTCCWVVERKGRLVGFAVGSTRHTMSRETSLGQKLTRLFGYLGSDRRRRILVDLFDVAVDSAWASSGVERDLLERLHEQLCHQAEQVRIMVPESSLASQVFLHEAGYQAVRVLRRYYGDQDGYLMQRLSMEEDHGISRPQTCWPSPG